MTSTFIIYFKIVTRAVKMKASNKYVLISRIFLSLIFISLICLTNASKTKCKASENQKWNEKKKKCVECPKCSPGSFRNLSEKYKRREGEHGAERCIKCRPCPAGTYSSRGYGECSKCRMNCTEFNRETSEPCTRQHDAKCGSCLNGYFDMYKNTLFPCAPNTQREPRLLINGQRKKPDKTPADSTVKEDSTDNDGSLGQDASVLQPQQGASKGTPVKTSVNYVNITLYCISGFVFVGAMTGLVLKIKANRDGQNATRNSHRPTINGHYASVTEQDLSQDNDIEMDTFGQNDESVAEQYNLSQETHFQMTPTSLETRIPMTSAGPPLPQARAELSRQFPTNQLDAINNSEEQTRLLGRYEQRKDICKCRKTNKCLCKTLIFPDNDIILEKSDEYVLKVAENICHDSFPLFSELGLEDAVIFQENNTRERDPENFSEKNLVTNLLNRWIERTSKPTLRQLTLALCKTSFHGINEKLHDLSILNDVTVS